VKFSPKLFLFILAIPITFGVGYAWQDLKQGKAPTVPRSRPAAVASVTPTQLFKQNFNLILRDYTRSVDATDLKYAAMEGTMAALGDPHTQFMEPKITADFTKETKGNVDFVGVGARLMPDPLGAKVVSVFRNGPAFRAGVKAGDMVVEVDRRAVGGMEIDDIVSKIRGKDGTPVTLTVLRAGGKTENLTMNRAKVVAPTVDYAMVPGTRVGMITVIQFAETTVGQFDQALDDLLSQNMEGLVIDLRNNPGGLLETAVEMLSRFVEDKQVVKMRFRDGNEQVERTYHGLKKDLTLPLMVLINEDSASAAEIFSGVLHDYRLATLVGEHTYGKASVQNVFYMVDGSSAKITIAKYFLPSGNDIARKVDEEGSYVSGGIKPDVEVSLSMAPGTALGDLKTDNQLQKAVELIDQKRR